MKATTTDSYGIGLDRLLYEWQRGLLLCAAVHLLGVLLLTLLVYGLLDYLLALNMEVRVLLSALVFLALLALGVVRFGRILVQGRRDVAIHADELDQEGRRRLQSNFELLEQLKQERAQNPNGFRTYLLEQELAQAGQHLESVERRGVWPGAQLRSTLKVFAWQAGVVLFVAVFNLATAGASTMRMLVPWVDTPPVSAYTFAVTPGQAQVIYGDELEVFAKIEGAEVQAPVYLLTRRDGVLHRIPCFQAGDGTYSQRLGNITSPVAFCFSTGKARSHWHEVDVVYLPRVAMAGATIYPPAYLQHPSQQLILGEEDLQAIVGSRVRLTVTSNRPLSGGDLRIRAEGAPDAEVELVPGELTGLHTVQFEWTVQENAGLEVQIEDLQGTKNEQPYLITQTAQPDEPPVVQVATPQPFVLATPQTRIPIKATVDDDFGLQRVSYVRKVVGLRNRAKRLAENLPEKRYEYHSELDLGRQGVRPGDELELYFEASDHNPSLLGMAASEVVRIQVISDAEYAERLRQETSLKDFIKRYEVLNQQLHKQQQMAQQLQEALKKEEVDSEELEKSLSELREQNQANQELFQKIAQDFPAFASDPQLSETAQQIAEQLKTVGESLKTAQVAHREDLQQRLEKIAPQMEQAQQQMQRQSEIARQAEELAPLMQHAATYAQLVEAQRQLESQSERFNNPSQSYSERELRAMARQQQEIRERLEKMSQEMVAEAAKLGDEHAEVKDSAYDFYNKMQDLKIGEAMAEGVQAGQNNDGPGLSRQAGIARQKMEELVQQCQGGAFGGMCEGQIRFVVKEGGGGMKETMQQLLSGLMAPGGGGSSGEGPGGPSASGYWSQGRSMMAVPIYGPARTQLTPPASRSSVTSFSATGEGETSSSRQVDLESTQMEMEREFKSEGERFPQEMIPEQYREAVRQFYSQPTTTPQAP